MPSFRFGEACLQGLEGFSHVEILFIFDQFPEEFRPVDIKQPAWVSTLLAEYFQP